MQYRGRTVDKNAAYPKAFKELKTEKVFNENTEFKPYKYLNNIVEQDHRTVKKISRAGLGYKSFHTASKTIKGIEIVHAINKGQVTGVNRRDEVAIKSNL